MVGYQQEAGQEPIMCADERQATTETIKAEPTCSTAVVGGSGATAYRYALPKWIEHDRKVLRFFGYFQEHVTESPQENSRIRKVVVMYYLEDDTLQVSEPQQENSGLPHVRPASPPHVCDDSPPPGLLHVPHPCSHACTRIITSQYWMT
jgi:EF-hand domain-containing protein 1